MKELLQRLMHVWSFYFFALRSGRMPDQTRRLFMERRSKRWTQKRNEWGQVRHNAPGAKSLAAAKIPNNVASIFSMQ